MLGGNEDRDTLRALAKGPRLQGVRMFTAGFESRLGREVPNFNGSCGCMKPPQSERAGTNVLWVTFSRSNTHHRVIACRKFSRMRGIRLVTLKRHSRETSGGSSQTRYSKASNSVGGRFCASLPRQSAFEFPAGAVTARPNCVPALTA
jgi:hypothetical protein